MIASCTIALIKKIFLFKEADVTFQQSFLDKVYTYRQCVLCIALSSVQQLHLEVFFFLFL